MVTKVGAMENEVKMFKNASNKCLTTEEALYKLNLAIEEIIVKQAKDDHVLSFRRFIFSDFIFIYYHFKILSVISTALMIVLLFLSVRFSKDVSFHWYVSTIIEIVVVTIMLFLVIYIFYLSSYKAVAYPYNQLRKMTNSIMEIISKLKDDPSQMYTCLSVFRGFTSIDLCPVIRDGKLLSVFTCLLVEDDIIYCDETQKNKLLDIIEKNDLEIMKENASGEWIFYRLKVTPAIIFFKNAFDSINKKELSENYYLKNFRDLYMRFSSIILIIMLLNLFTYSLRLILGQKTNIYHMDSYKTGACVLLLACPAPFLIFNWIKVTYITSALISRLKNVHYLKRVRVTDGFIAIIHWLRIWILNAQDFPYFHYKFVFEIATLKSCICADRDSILTLSHKKPKGMYIFEEASKLNDNQPNYVFKNTDIVNPIAAEMRKISMDSLCNMTAIEFETLYGMICSDLKAGEKSIAMKRSHTFSNHLRAISNNIIFNQICSKPTISMLLESISNSSKITNDCEYFDCKCSIPLLSQCVNLEKFNVNFVNFGGNYLQKYNNSIVNHCVTSFSQPTKFNEAIYVNSFGSVDIIIDICNKIFTGTGYASMTELARKQLKKINLQLTAQGPCLAFSYKSIIKRFDSSLPFALGNFSFTFMHEMSKFGTMIGESTSNDHFLNEFSSRFEESRSMSSQHDLEEALKSNFFEKSSIDDVSADIPIFNLSSKISRRKSEDYPRFLQNHIFLGLVSFTSVPKKEAFDFVQYLLSKYIRFAYFSRDNQVLSRNLAISLGLEANWNMFVSLKKTKKRSKLHQLPSGIKKIVKHIKLNDDIPLNVNLYTDCTNKTIEQMMDVSLEYNDNFLLIGSCLNFSNCNIYLKSSTSFLLLPNIDAELCVKEDELNDRNHPLCYDVNDGHEMNRFHKCIPYSSPLTSLAALIISFGSLLALKKNSYVNIARIIFNARRYIHNLMSSDLLYSFLILLINIQHFINIAFLYPPHLSFHHTLWLIIFVFPMLALGIFMTNRNPELVEDNVSPPPNSSYANLWKATLLTIFCVVIPITICQLFCFQAHIYYVLCRLYAEDSTKCVYFFPDLHTQHFKWNDEKISYANIVWFVQNISTSTTIFIIAIGSIAFISLHTSVFNYSLKNVKRWIVVFFVVIFAECVRLLATFVYYKKENFFGKYLMVVPVYAFINIPILSPLMIAGIELIKKYHLKKFNEEFRRKHLTFETRLGMHSPIF